MLNDLKDKIKEDIDILTKEDFEVLFGKYGYIKGELKKVSKGMSTKLAQKCFHLYNVPKDTTENYISEIISEDKGKIKDLLEEDKGKCYNYIFERLRSQDYLCIRRLKTKNPNEFKYKVFLNIKVKKDTDKFNILNDIVNELSFFDIISKKIYDTSKSIDKDLNKDPFFEVKNDEIIYKVMLYGKPTKAFIYMEDLEQEIESTVNKLNCKVQDLDIKVIKNFRKSLYYDIESIDFSDTEDAFTDIISDVDKKTLFYAYINDFGLNDAEKTIINLTFQGYNLYRDEDLDYFKEALKQKTNKSFSGNYLRKTFLDKLCKKLAKNSPFRDVEVSNV